MTQETFLVKWLFEKCFAVIGTFKSPVTPLKKGDLGGYKTFDTDKRTFQTSSDIRHDLFNFI